MKKRILALLLALALLCALTACGDSGEAATDSTGSETEATSDAETEEDASEQESADEAETETEADSGDDADSSEAADDESTESDDSDYVTTHLDDSTCEITDCYLTEAETIVVPETIGGRTVVGIGGYAFTELEAKEISLPDTLEYIGQAAFVSCENLETVNLGSGLKTIESLAFTNCNSLKSLTFPEGMETFEDTPFSLCESLVEVYIPDSVTNFGGVITYLDLCPNIVIVTPSGSAAEAKAIEDGLPVENP
ncbi:MAG: leucine-rich repeat protein [Clostridiales bacterium]|nr:leucine-rich repeat protein [Clostridiales bacterium]